MASREVYIDAQCYDINYEILNPQAKKNFIVLHGWGSNKEVMKSAFKNHLSSHKHIYIDLPGFGKSTNSHVLTTNDYVRIVSHFLKELSLTLDIIAGHSFGGKVATLLNPSCLVLLSSAGIVEPKPWKVRAKIAFFKLLKPLGGANLYKLFATKDADNLPKHMYETLKNVVDEDFSAYFRDYKGTAQIFWGKEDTATSLSSGEQIAYLIENSNFYPLSGDHYFFIKHAKLISEEIEQKC